VNDCKYLLGSSEDFRCLKGYQQCRSSACQDYRTKVKPEKAAIDAMRKEAVSDFIDKIHNKIICEFTTLFQRLINCHDKQIALEILNNKFVDATKSEFAKELNQHIQWSHEHCDTANW